MSDEDRQPEPEASTEPAALEPARAPEVPEPEDSAPEAPQPDGSELDVPAPEAPDAPRSAFSVIGHGCGVIAALVLVVGVLLTGLMSLGVWAVSRTTTAVPSVSGLRVPDATKQVLAAELATAPMQAFATSRFEPDVVMQQLPEFGTKVAPGTSVDFLVAVAPTPTVVPDLYCDTASGAAAKLEYGLLKPVLYEQLSDTVPFGRVVAQMPRAGQPVMTGQQVALFVSMGQGRGGAVVPSVLGKSLSEAATEVANAYLVAMLFDPHPGQPLSGTVTDQVPAPGSRVPIGSAVPLFTSTSTR